MTDHDHGYKRLFSHPGMIRNLLHGFVSADWIAQLDFTTLGSAGALPVDRRKRLC